MLGAKAESLLGLSSPQHPDLKRSSSGLFAYDAIHAPENPLLGFTLNTDIAQTPVAAESYPRQTA
jgi:hypothetical protein